MPSEGGQLVHGRVLPHDDGILRIAVRADELVGVAAPANVADLQGTSHVK